MKRYLALLASAGFLAGANAELQGRDLDLSKSGFEAYYDTDLNITWLTDFSTFAKQTGDVDGKASWADAQSWISSLNSSHYLGADGWRLPKTSPVNGTSFQLTSSNNGSTDVGTARTGAGWGTASELGHLYYVTLGNKGLCTPTVVGTNSCAIQPGWDSKNFGPLSNLLTYVYWTGTNAPAGSSQAWYFYALYGNQDIAAKTEGYGVIAVRDGDLASAVPEPTAAFLMILGLGALTLTRRRA